MQIRFQNSPKEVKAMNTEELREHYLCESLMQDDAINYVYSHHDRMITGGAKPVQQNLLLRTHDELKADYFLERREMGIINVGGLGVVEADGIKYELEKLSCLYVGKGTKEVQFTSEDKNNPAVFFLLSAPAHHTYPNKKMKKDGEK